MTFGPGETTKEVAVTVNGDALDEADETFSLQLSSPTGATITDATGIATIVDDDPLPGVDRQRPERRGGRRRTSSSPSRCRAASGRAVTVDYATADGTATSAMMLDYTAKTGTLTFVPSVVTQTVSVPITSDSLDELDETVLLNLSLPVDSPATITDAQGIGTIVDDDGPTISIDDVTLAPEGATGTTQTATFTISLSTASAQTVTVRYATANGTAVAPADYTAVALTTVTFAPGETTKQVAVTVNGDALDEVDETFQVQLSAPAAGTPMNATIQDAAGIATIPDDDPLPALSVSDPTVAEGTGTSRSLVFTVTLAPVSGRTVTVDYATADGPPAPPAPSRPARRSTTPRATAR